MKIQITKEFSFEAAHALDGYNGKCKNIHGHSYKLDICVSGTPNDKKDDSSYGMVMDFKEIKVVYKQEINPLFDHRLILKDDSRFKDSISQYKGIRFVPYQPTCENMLIEIVQILQGRLPKDVTLELVRLRETVTSYAEWLNDLK